MAQEAVAANGVRTAKKPHAVVIPYPLQGHGIPAAHLALRLAARGFAVTFVNTESVHQQTAGALGLGLDADGNIFAGAREDVRYELVSDGFPLGFDRSLNHDQFMEGRAARAPGAREGAAPPRRHGPGRHHQKP